MHLEHLKCPACEGERTKRLFGLDERVSKGDLSVVRCEDCGISWTAPLPDKADIAALYPPEYYGSGKERFPSLVESLVRLSRRRRARKIIKLNSGIPGRVLDIGCGRGWMLNFLKMKGWEAYGTELSSESSHFAREHLKLNDVIIINKVEDCSFPSSHFDVVTLWHTLEHLLEPFRTLEEVNRILKEDGLLIIEVPNFGGLQAGMFGNKWFHLDSPRHLYHFDNKTLKRILEGSGFSVIESRNISLQYDLFGFVQSVLNYCCFRFDFLYHFLRDKKVIVKNDPLRYLYDLVVSFILLPVLLTISIPVTLFSSLLLRGGTIRYYCRKSYGI